MWSGLNLQVPQYRLSRTLRKTLLRVSTFRAQDPSSISRRPLGVEGAPSSGWIGKGRLTPCQYLHTDMKSRVFPPTVGAGLSATMTIVRYPCTTSLRSASADSLLDGTVAA